MIKSYLGSKDFFKPKRNFRFKKYIPLTIVILLAIFFIVQIALPIINKKTKTDYQLLKKNSGKVLGAATNLPLIDNILVLPIINNKNRPLIYAKSVILIDEQTFYPVYEKNSYEVLPIASLTKIMTAIVALEHYKLTDEMVVSGKAVSTIGSDIQLKPGEKLTFESLLQALLINSANDAAVTLAENYGSEEQFVQLMNNKAKLIGLNNTRFEDTVGLSPNNKSTVFDLAVLMSYAAKNPKILEIIKTRESSITSIDGKFTHQLKNSNRLIQLDEKYFIPEVIGGKTGFTFEAGHCLATITNKDGHILISVVLSTDENTITASAAETNKLLRWAFENVTWNS